MQRYLTKNLPKFTSSTQGVEFSTKTVQLKNGKQIKAKCWDFPGQQQQRDISLTYIAQSNGAIVVFDLTNEKTFENVGSWIEEIKKRAEPDVVILLLGNKLDKVQESSDLRKVSNEEVQKIVGEHKVLYEEVSALKDLNVEKAINQLAEEMAAIEAKKHQSCLIQ